MARKPGIEHLKETFSDKENFSRKELYDFYKSYDPDLNETTFRWRIHKLKDKKIISSVSKDLFTFSYKPVFIPDISETERNIYCKVEQNFPTLKACIWSTKIINEFMLHMPVNYLTILQVEREAMEPVYFFLKEKEGSNIFIQPGEKEIDRYIFENNNSIIIEPLISKSPVQKVDETTTITLEKLIVDLFSDKKLFNAYQGGELSHIINSAYSRYSIDFTKLFYYAKRRGKKEELMEFLFKKTYIPQNILINDKY